MGGIGTTTPWKSSFAIEQNGANPSFVVGDTGTSTPLFFISANGRIGIGTSSPGALFAIDTTTVAHPARNLFYIGSSTANNFVVDNRGFVGIGTAASETRLHIVSSGGSGTEVRADSFDDDNGVQSQFVVRKAKGTISSPTALTSGHRLGSFSFRGYDGTSFSGSRAIITARTEEAWTTTNQGARLEFHTTPIGSTTLTERMRIDSSGNLGIGTTSPWGLLSVDQVAATGRLKPLFVVGDNGTTTPFFFINQKGHVGFGTSTVPTNKNIEVNVSSAATTTVQIGSTSTTQGSCLQMYDAGGTAYRIYITHGSTTATMAGLGVEKGSCE